MRLSCYSSRVKMGKLYKTHNLSRTNLIGQTFLSASVNFVLCTDGKKTHDASALTIQFRAFSKTP